MYAQLLRGIYGAASEAKKFAELSGNRPEMMKRLIELPRVMDLEIRDCYVAKSEELASELLAKAREAIAKIEASTSHFAKVDDLLNDAAFACPKSREKYLEILMERALWSYKFSKFHRCRFTIIVISREKVI